MAKHLSRIRDRRVAQLYTLCVFTQNRSGALELVISDLQILNCTLKLLDLCYDLLSLCVDLLKIGHYCLLN